MFYNQLQLSPQQLISGCELLTAPPHSTKCNSPPINSQHTNIRCLLILEDLTCGTFFQSKQCLCVCVCVCVMYRVRVCFFVVHDLTHHLLPITKKNENDDDNNN